MGLPLFFFFFFVFLSSTCYDVFCHQLVVTVDSCVVNGSLFVGFLISSLDD